MISAAPCGQLSGAGRTAVFAKSSCVGTAAGRTGPTFCRRSDLLRFVRYGVPFRHSADGLFLPARLIQPLADLLTHLTVFAVFRTILRVNTACTEPFGMPHRRTAHRSVLRFIVHRAAVKREAHLVKIGMTDGVPLGKIEDFGHEAGSGEGSGTLVLKLERPDDSEKTVTFQKIQEQEG